MLPNHILLCSVIHSIFTSQKGLKYH